MSGSCCAWWASWSSTPCARPRSPRAQTTESSASSTLRVGPRGLGEVARDLAQHTLHQAEQTSIRPTGAEAVLTRGPRYSAHAGSARMSSRTTVFPVAAPADHPGALGDRRPVDRLHEGCREGRRGPVTSDMPVSSTSSTLQRTPGSCDSTMRTSGERLTARRVVAIISRIDAWSRKRASEARSAARLDTVGHVRPPRRCRPYPRRRACGRRSQASRDGPPPRMPAPAASDEPPRQPDRGSTEAADVLGVDEVACRLADARVPYPPRRRAAGDT